MTLLPWLAWGSHLSRHCCTWALCLPIAPQRWFCSRHCGISLRTLSPALGQGLRMNSHTAFWTRDLCFFFFFFTTPSCKVSYLCRLKLPSLLLNSGCLSCPALCAGVYLSVHCLEVLLGRMLGQTWNQFCVSLFLAGWLLSNSRKQLPHIFCLVLELFSQVDKLIPVTSLIEAKVSLSLKFNF